MTSIGTLRELDADVEEALTTAPVCERDGIEGHTLADWWVIEQCGCRVPLCNGCKAEDAAMPYNPSSIYTCLDCGRRTDGHPLRWEPIR